MKLLVSLNSKKLEDYLDYTNSFIIGLKDYSINYLGFSIDEIKDLLNKYDINLFVSINKNMFNDDIEDLKNKLLELDKLNIKGILYYDLSILELKNELNLKTDLVFHQTHMCTNYNICNYYYDKGVKYAYLSNEITKDEMIEIYNNTKIKLFGMVLGHPICSHSRRMLLSNYFDYFKKEKKNKTYSIKSGGSENYLIKESNLGTTILYGNIVNGVKPYFELKDLLEYIVLDEQEIDHDLFIKLLKLFYENKDKEYNKEFDDEVTNLIGNDTGFFYRKTIYKVK